MQWPLARHRYPANVSVHLVDSRKQLKATVRTRICMPIPPLLPLGSARLALVCGGGANEVQFKSHQRQGRWACLTTKDIGGAETQA